MLIILAYFGRDPYVCVAIMTISLGFNGAATASNLANSQDLAPNYAGTLYGIINCVGTTPGIFSPLIVAAFTKNEVCGDSLEIPNIHPIHEFSILHRTQSISGTGCLSLEPLPTYCLRCFSGSSDRVKSRSGTRFRPPSRERILSTQSCSLCPGNHL